MEGGVSGGKSRLSPFLGLGKKKSYDKNSLYISLGREMCKRKY